MLNALQLKIYEFKIYFGVKSQEVLVVKNLLANLGDIRDTGSIPRSGRSPGEGNGTPLQCSCLENGQRGLAGYSPWGHRESHMTEHKHTHRNDKF